MISALARANRSYCDGHAHNDLELRMCLTFITLCQPDVMQLIELCGQGCEFKIDPFVLDVSCYMFDRGAYAKGGFFSESSIHFLDLQISKKNYSKKLS